MIKAYEVAKEILHKRRSPYEDIKAEALIMLETNFPVYMHSRHEVGLEPGDYSNHDIHDAQNNWPYNLFHSMPIEEFAIHITEVGKEILPISDWVKTVCIVSRFVAAGEWFTVGSNLYMTEVGGRVSGMSDDHHILPFNYTNVGPNLQMVWANCRKLEEYTNTLIRDGQMLTATRSLSMDNELRLRQQRV